MKVCPNNALHPAAGEAGIEGLWTPVVAPRIGYCEPSCSLCGQACPTGAIWEFTAREKGWAAGSRRRASPSASGTAFYDRGRCLPWAMATECIVCEEWCPTSPKAIYLRPAEVADAAGEAKTVRQPYVDPARCVGCGACEYACPIGDRPAVYVTSIGESRSKANRILLERQDRRRAGKTMKYGAALAALAAALVAGCGGRRAADDFPRDDEVRGWKMERQPRVFQADNLWQYIDGDAERYLQAGFENVRNAVYQYRGRVEAAADIYTMKNPGAAAKVLDSEADVGSQPAALGDGGKVYRASIVFRKGRHFVRLIAYQDHPDGQKALMELAQAIAERLT